MRSAILPAILAIAGQKLGQHYRAIDQVLGPASMGITIALMLVYAWRVWTHREAAQSGN